MSRRKVVRLLTIPVVVAVLAGGFYVISRNAPTGGLVAIAMGLAWVGAAAALFAWLARRDRVALRMVIGAAALTAVVGGFLIRPQGNEVDEDIVTAAPSAMAADEPRRGDDAAPPRNAQVLAGSFSGASGHSGKGKATVVKLADGGRKLTFSDFDVDPGAGGGLRVYLTAGRPKSDGAVRDFINLAPLKGTKGNQQYELPRNVNLRRYSTVVVWCVPFTTRIAQAPLG